MKYDFDSLAARQNKDSVKWSCGDNLISMGIADMDFDTVPEVKEAIAERALDGIYGYSELPSGYHDAVINWLERRHKWKIEKEWLCISPGIVTAISIAISALTHPGDKVLVQSPVYYPFFSSITRNGCEIVNNPLIFDGDRYSMNFEDLENKAADERVKLLILCNPHNPVGRVWKEEELQRIGGICIKNNVLVLADEIHMDLVYKGNSYTPFASLSKEFEENSITFTAPSKTFNLAGLQTSNIIIPDKWLRQKYKISLENIGVSRLNLFGGTACKSAYTHGEHWLSEVLEYIEGNKNFAINYIKDKIPQLKVIEPEGTYLLWIDCRKLKLNNEELKKFMLNEAKIIFNEGYIFGEGGTGFERMNIACPRAVLEEALNNLKKSVNKITNG